MASNKRSPDDDNTTSRKSAKKQQDKGSSSSSVAAENTNPNIAKVFTCDICQKTFSQGRALGGHKSSHNKYKCIIVNTIEEDMKKNARSNPKNNRSESCKVDDDHQQVKDDGHQQIKDDDHQQIKDDKGDDQHGDWTMASVESSTSQESYDAEDLDDSDSDDDEDHRFHECMECEMIFEAKKLLEEHNRKYHGEDHHSGENNSSYIDLNKPYEGEG